MIQIVNLFKLSSYKWTMNSGKGVTYNVILVLSCHLATWQTSFLSTPFCTLVFIKSSDRQSWGRTAFRYVNISTPGCRIWDTFPNNQSTGPAEDFHHPRAPSAQNITVVILINFFICSESFIINHIFCQLTVILELSLDSFFSEIFLLFQYLKCILNLDFFHHFVCNVSPLSS